MPRYNRYNPYYNQNRMTLNTAGFTPVVFNPIQFQPVEANVNIMHNAMAQQRETAKQAMEQKSARDVALGKIEASLNPSELSWFNEQKRKMDEESRKYIELGDFSGALNYNIAAASIPFSDTEWIAREKNSLEYDAKMQELDKMVQSGYIRNTTANYIKKKNPYSNEIKRDENGIAIGFDKWDLKVKPVKDLDINQLFQDAFKTINPDTKVWNRSSNLVDNKGKVTYSRNGVESDLKESHSGQTVSVTPEEILDNAITILKQNSDWGQQLEQLYGGAWEKYLDDLIKLNKLEVGSAEYNSLKYILDEQKSMFYDDNIPKMNDTDTASVYFAKMLFNSKEAQALGYSNTNFTNSYIKDKLNSGSEHGKVTKSEVITTNAGEEVIMQTFEDGFVHVSTFD